MACESFKKIFKFVWKIENYSICNQRNTEYILSPIFTAECLSGSRWYLQLFPRGDGDENKNWVSCFLFRNKDDVNDEDMIVDFSLDILKPNGEIFYTTEKIMNKNIRKTSNWGFPALIEIDELNAKMNEWNEDLLTIRCFIAGQCPNYFYEFTTTIDCNRCYFNWDISNLESDGWTGNKTTSLLEKTSIKISLIAPDNYILIHIKESKLPFLKCKVMFAKNEIELMSNTSSHLFDNFDDIWEFPTFIQKSFLNNRNIRETFTLKFEFFFANSNESISSLTDKINPEKYFDKVDAVQNLRADLNGLLLESKHTDVKFKIGDHIIEAHKNILSARSPVFSAMFDQEMVENETGVIEIVDIDVEVLNSFLKFVYTGTVDNMDYDTAMKLLIVAHKYEASSLENSCSNVLMSATSIENVYDILVASDMIGHKGLREFTLDFIQFNASKILSSPMGPELIEANSKLGFEIISKLWVYLGKEAHKP